MDRVKIKKALDNIILECATTPKKGQFEMPSIKGQVYCILDANSTKDGIKCEFLGAKCTVQYQFMPNVQDNWYKCTKYDKKVIE